MDPTFLFFLFLVILAVLATVTDAVSWLRSDGMPRKKRRKKTLIPLLPKGGVEDRKNA